MYLNGNYWLDVLVTFFVVMTNNKESMEGRESTVWCMVQGDTFYHRGRGKVAEAGGNCRRSTVR